MGHWMKKRNQRVMAINRSGTFSSSEIPFDSHPQNSTHKTYEIPYLFELGHLLQ